ncbi:MAG: hypothetical protein Q3977_00405 [Oscillospiraceae bacterium]|nr:hypothetical protein [Oscillospiraceae bacterium]
MTDFLSLSAPLRAVFALWALLLLLVAGSAAALSATRRRLRPTALALALFAPVYFLWQVIFDVSLFGGTENAAKLSLLLSRLPIIAWLAAFCLLTLAAALLLGSNLRYDRTFITPHTVKLFLDRLPCGICCWRESGSVLFSNVCMSRLCEALTGAGLLNGNHFRAAVQDRILTVDGRVWRFSCRDLVCGGERLHELIASDITDEYAKTQALEKDRAELASLNRELREYYEGIDDVVRREEILQAKITIHDEMNRLMLSTTAAGSENTEELDRIFSLWEQNALLLGRASGEENEASDMAEQLAAALGVRLSRDALPEMLTEKQRELFRSAEMEALVNAVKHAGAKTLTVSFSETESTLDCRFSNDGKPPRGDLRFTGGLANLSLLAGRQGAIVSADCGGGFTLWLRFPKETGQAPPNG